MSTSTGDGHFRDRPSLVYLSRHHMTDHQLDLRIVSPADDELGYLGNIGLSGDLVVCVGGSHGNSTLLASSDGRHFHVLQGPRANGLRDVAFAGSEVFVCGEYGLLAVSRDRLRTWEVIETPTGVALMAMSFDANGRLWVTAHDGTILRSDDGGRTVEVVHEATGGPLLAILVDGDRVLFAGSKLLAYDDGHGFSMLEVDPPSLICELIRSGSALVAVGDGGLILRSMDSGASWGAIDCPVNADLESAAASERGLFVVGSEGVVLRSDDHGAIWSAIETELADHLWCVRATSSGLFIGGDEGLVLRCVFDEGADPWAGREDLFDQPTEVDRLFEVEPGEFLAESFEAWLQLGRESFDEGEGEDGEDEEDEDDDVEEDEEDGEDEVAPYILLGVGGGPEDFAATWGLPMPDELRDLQTLLGRYPERLYEWRSEIGVLPNLPEHNLFELVVRRDQDAYLGTGLAECFGGNLCLGTLGNGDSYHYSIYPHGEAQGRPIVFWNHETHDFEFYFARDLSSLVYLSSACEARTGGMSPSGFAQAIERVEGKVAPSWHFRSSLQRAGKDEFEDWAPDDQMLRFWFYRARWLIYLLKSDGVHDVDDAGQMFEPSFNPVIDDERHAAWLQGCRDFAPTALYLLWRCWFFGDERHLAEYMAIAREHAARIVRDAAKLIDELEAGRRSLGNIDDMHALREKFQALDIDPARARQREAEAEARKQARERRREELRGRVAAAVERGESLGTLAWEGLRDRDLHLVVAEVMRGQEVYAPTLTVLDWICGGGGSRDGLYLEHEVDETAECLATLAHDDVIPLIVGALAREDRWDPELKGEAQDEEGDEDDDDGEQDSWLAIKRPPASLPTAWGDARILRFLARAGRLDSRVAAALRPNLEARDERYEHRRTTTVSVLGALRDAGCVPALLEILATLRLDGDFVAKIRNEDVVKASVGALGAIGDPSASEALAALLAEEDSDYDEVRPLAAAALAEIGATGPLDAMLDMLAELDADEGASLAWAAARIGAGADASQRDRVVATLEAWDAEDEVPAKLARAGGLALLGADSPELVRWVGEALGTVLYDRDDTVELHRFALEILGRCDAVPIELALPFARRDDFTLRDAAREALARREAEVPSVRPMYEFTIHELDAEAVATALRSDDACYKYNLAQRAAREGLVACRPAILEQIRANLGNMRGDGIPADIEYAHRWMVMSLIELGPDDSTWALIHELLTSDNRDIKDPVLRRPPRHEALIPGMLHVEHEAWGWQGSTAKAWLADYVDTDAYRQALKARRAK